MQEAQQSDDDILLINVVIEQMICDTDPELRGAVQIMGLLCTLIDPENKLAPPLLTNPSEDKCEKDRIVGSNKDNTVCPDN
ncbi:Hypothetical predicted protein [Marmota monax]|uniref:Serine/threonine-protein phosphatase 4 regulatory subunit 3-like central domain-containing protein n=1 Tax=Marmota monax TaxID=9995 RepID=A0A5E4D6L1_MARMO|nr:hypothetical protein GHT09_004178 [Marmota monax]VTJ88802.1 Hypothetical predicted protein [Marmota monax]